MGGVCYLWRVTGQGERGELLAVVAYEDVYRFVFKNPSRYCWARVS